jgi:hypothetical protein
MGTACGLLAACVVWVGWVFLAYLVLQGVGGFVLSFFRGTQPQPAPQNTL